MGEKYFTTQVKLRLSSRVIIPKRYGKFEGEFDDLEFIKKKFVQFNEIHPQIFHMILIINYFKTMEII